MRPSYVPGSGPTGVRERGAAAAVERRGEGDEARAHYDEWYAVTYEAGNNPRR